MPVPVRAKMSMKNTLEKRILIFAFLALTVTIAVNTAFNIENFRRNYRDGILLRSDSLAAGVKSSVEKSLQQGGELVGLVDLAGHCQQIVSHDPELAYCLIEDGMGRGLFANDLPVAVADGLEFVTALSDSTSLLTHPTWGRVYDVSLPLLGRQGGVAGRVRIGFSEAVLTERTQRMLHHSLMVLGLAFLVVLTLVIVFTKRHLIGPIRRLCEVAREITSGNFQVVVPAMPTPDFTRLATSLQEMAGSLQRRDEALQQGYRELEETNLLLQQIYEEQEKTGIELVRSQKMHLALFENASDAIVISDHQDRIILFNRRAEEFFGIGRDQVINRNLFRSMEMLGGDPHLQYQFYRELLDGGRNEVELAYVRHADQQPVTGSVSATVARDRHGSFWVQMVIRDITRERQIKENLEKSAREMERLNQMKDSFLGLASHELKTPLTVIVGYADLILGDADVQVESEVLQMVQHISAAAERLTDVVKDMVDVSMLDSRRLPLELRPADLNALVRQIIAGNSYSLSQRQQQVELICEADLPLVECDPDRLQQAIGHLLGNAIKFTPDGGLIRVQTRCYTPLLPQAAVKGGEKVEFIISDTGIGIAESDRPHVFDKFFEGGEIEEHFTGKVAFMGKGAGLGLTIAKGIIELHGGRIWVESPGHDPQQCPGSTFHVLLPVCHPQRSHGQGPVSPCRGGDFPV
ncbi:MAG: PAS domain S-box protein [Desulfuromonadales bacterium]|nr:PAS domain S-box protein [Desulfuromonadales bacterium]